MYGDMAVPEHPRVGGEDRDPRMRPKVVVGKPPRRRGGRIHPREQVHRERSTPASAGRTRSSARFLTAAPEHPRVGGEDDRNSVGESLSERNTLASAGRTPTSPSPSPSRTEHPRVGGEDDVVMWFSDLKRS